MLRRMAELFVIVAALVTLTKAATSAEDRVQSERLAMYYRYLDFESLLKGGSIHPHWMTDGSSFWYAEVLRTTGSFGRSIPKTIAR
jgi:hypothetical protein